MKSIHRLLDIVATLRAPGGCPWDQEQNHQSIRMQLVEECYELVEAIDDLDDVHMKEELGDVLLHVVFHSQLAKERGVFDFEQVANEVSDKIVRRHPHVFDKEKIETSEGVLKRWEEIKKKEKPERTSALDGVPRHAPALMFAQQIQKKAGKVGFDWKEISQVVAKVHEELAEVEKAIAENQHIEEELGDLLYATVNLCRHLKLDAEQACRLATQKFIKRFLWVEEKMKADQRSMKDATIEELDFYWEMAKKATKQLPQQKT